MAALVTGALYQSILERKAKGEKQLFALLDPDKLPLEAVMPVTEALRQAPVQALLLGGSSGEMRHIGELSQQLREKTQVPVCLFPGGVDQLTEEADALFFLSLLSGDNPEFLIGQQRLAAARLAQTQLEVIPTAYVLVGSDPTAVSRVSQTQPIAFADIDTLIQTARAAYFLGFRLLYLEAGSGAATALPVECIRQVRAAVDLPIIVGGGMRSREAVEAAWQAGADVVVVGTAFEENLDWFRIHFPKTITQITHESIR